MATPKSASTGYKVSLTVNLGNFNSAKFELSEELEFNVEGLSQDEIIKSLQMTREEMAIRLSDEVTVKGNKARDEGEIT